MFGVIDRAIKEQPGCSCDYKETEFSLVKISQSKYQLEELCLPVSFNFES